MLFHGRRITGQPISRRTARRPGLALPAVRRIAFGVEIRNLRASLQ